MNSQQAEFRAHLEWLRNERYRKFYLWVGTGHKRNKRFERTKKGENKVADFTETFLLGAVKSNRIARWRKHFRVAKKHAIDAPAFIYKLISGSVGLITLRLLTLCVIAYFVSFVVVFNRYDNAYWSMRINERILSPIYGRDDVLVGAIQRTGAKTNYHLGFIPLPSKTPLPPVYRAALLEREDRGLRDGGIHQIFGIDFPRLLWAWINLRGGSSLTMQIVKNLEGWGSEDTFQAKVLRKLVELPAAIQLYRHIDRQGGDTQNNIIRLYAGVHKIWTPDTGIRGIEAGARVTFDTTPDGLTTAQQLLLSAVTGRPLFPPSEEDADKTPCKKIWPKKQNDEFDPVVEERVLATASDYAILQFRRRQSQCRTLWRARHTKKLGMLLHTD